MRIVSWNINGLRAVIKNRSTSVKGFLDSLSADVICLQEIKTTRDQLDETIAIIEGYTSYFSFCRVRQGYSGVVTFCRTEVTPIAAEEGITGCTHGNRKDSIGFPITDLSEEEQTLLDNEGRALLTEHIQDNGRRLVIINVYCPRVDAENPERLPYKLNFVETLFKRCTALQSNDKDVIVCGDMNCVLDVIDSATLQDMPTFSKEPETRQLLYKYVSPLSPDNILVDTYRYLHPDVMGAYTCWCTVTESRKLNYGQRIDYIFISSRLAHTITSSAVLQEEYGSDHCPVRTELSLTLSPSSVLPSLCSSHFPEFAGKQSKLSTFFSRKDNIKRPLSEPSKKAKKVCLDSQTSLKSYWKMEETSSIKEDIDTNCGQVSHFEMSCSSKLSSDWQQIFKPPPKPPLCSGHKEPSVLRVVKKSGPTKNKKFYCCARPDGSKNDPNSRCNFFQWSS